MAELEEPQRWIATVKANGEPDGDPVPYNGFDDSEVCISRVSTYGSGDDTPVSFIAATPEEALAGARQCWERSEAGRQASEGA